jgi:hypothetical protein
MLKSLLFRPGLNPSRRSWEGWLQLASVTFVLLVLMCGWMSAQSPRKMVTLSGYVRDNAGAAVAGARIESGGRSTVSDAKGAYLLILPVGPTRLEVSERTRLSFSVGLDLMQDRVLDVR